MPTLGLNPIRIVLVLIAVTALAAEAIGTYLAVAGGATLGSWQLTSIGVGVPAACLAVLIAWHRPHNRIAWIFAAAALQFGLEMVFLGIMQTAGSVPPSLRRAALAGLEVGAGPLTITWVLLILLFPDGSFHGRRWVGFAIGAAAVAAGASTLQWLISPPGFLPPHFDAIAPAWLSGPLTPGASVLTIAQALELPLVLLPLVAVGGFVDRYRRSSITVRQQTTWVLYGVAINVAFQVAGVALNRLGVSVPAPITLAVAPLTILGAALAIFRYRLWDIDRLVSRTVAFALLWGLSTGVFIALVVAAGIAVGGTDRRLYAAVALAVLVALLAQPLRSRLERRIGRLVYGEKARGYAALALLRPALEGVVPLYELPKLVAETTSAAVGARWSAVWLRVEVEGRELLKLAATVGDDAAVASIQREPAILDPAPAIDVLATALPVKPGLIHPLVAGDERIGFLACGGLPGEGATSDDREILSTVARQSALVLRNARLEEEMTQRLLELRESRQRLVGAQDDERRKLERDLHDGVQQQLVTLAARLRRTSADGGSRQDLEALAAEAEEAVFSLQDLARGIYPSVLADRGLAEALRAHSVRIPVHVHVEVEPGLVERRFNREIEAGLYFVALEAITNAQKHAGKTAITVALRSEASGSGLVLEVHDDGDGFHPTRQSSGSGLRNMSDRVFALGGRFAVDSQPGAGTWIRASVPLAADVLPIQAPGTAARR